MEDKEYFVHESSYVDNPCSIGKGTKIWHFCHIMAGARIGEGCSIGQNVSIASSAVIGNGVRIQNNVSIYDGVVCEDDVFLGPSCVFTNVVNPRSFISRKHEYRETRIGKGASIGANATIVCGHSCREICSHRCRYGRNQGRGGLYLRRRESGKADVLYLPMRVQARRK